VVPLETRHSHQFINPEAYRWNILMEWVPTAVSDPGLLNGLMLYACRSLYVLTGETGYYDLALRYKLACMSIVNDEISASSGTGTVGPVMIARVLQLASDELRRFLPLTQPYGISL
jgi:hypothetical protein